MHLRGPTSAGLGSEPTVRNFRNFGGVTVIVLNALLVCSRLKRSSLRLEAHQHCKTAGRRGEGKRTEKDISHASKAGQ